LTLANDFYLFIFLFNQVCLIEILHLFFKRDLAKIAEQIRLITKQTQTIPFNRLHLLFFKE